MTGGAVPLVGSAAVPLRSFNVRTIKRNGIACTSQTAVAEVASCIVTAEETKTDCRAKIDQALATQTCAHLKAGTQATIEAGSHSFDWVRFRVSGQTRALWAERRLVLD